MQSTYVYCKDTSTKIFTLKFTEIITYFRSTHFGTNPFMSKNYILIIKPPSHEHISGIFCQYWRFSASIGSKTGHAKDRHLCHQYWHLCLQSLFWSETERMNGGSFDSQCTQIRENLWSKDAILTLCLLWSASCVFGSQSR